jgi:hypothetical protein
MSSTLGSTSDNASADNSVQESSLPSIQEVAQQIWERIASLFKPNQIKYMIEDGLSICLVLNFDLHDESCEVFSIHNTIPKQRFNFDFSSFPTVGSIRSIINQAIILARKNGVNLSYMIG